MWIAAGVIMAICCFTFIDSGLGFLTAILSAGLGLTLQGVSILKQRLDWLQEAYDDLQEQTRHAQRGLEKFSNEMVAQVAQIKETLKRVPPSDVAPSEDFALDVPAEVLQPTTLELNPQNQKVADFFASLTRPQPSDAPAVAQKSAPMPAPPDNLSPIQEDAPAIAQGEAAKPDITQADALILSSDAEPVTPRVPQPAQAASISSPLRQQSPYSSDAMQETMDMSNPLIAYAKNWLLGGNPLVRVGVLLLFLGVAFLLRYVAQSYTFPIELRYISVAFVALAGLVFGWYKRTTRPDFALVLQGGAFALFT